jgi:hypothetical protein
LRFSWCRCGVYWLILCGPLHVLPTLHPPQPFLDADRQTVDDLLIVFWHQIKVSQFLDYLLIGGLDEPLVISQQRDTELLKLCDDQLFLCCVIEKRVRTGVEPCKQSLRRVASAFRFS